MNGPAEELFVHHYAKMARGDLRSLSNNNYVNEEIIDNYVKDESKKSLMIIEIKY